MFEGVVCVIRTSNRREPERARGRITPPRLLGVGLLAFAIGVILKQGVKTYGTLAVQARRRPQPPHKLTSKILNRPTEWVWWAIAIRV